MSTPEPSPPRLSLGTLSSLGSSLRPAIDPRAVAVGIVHLGLGAFHRAHQAIFTEDAMLATGELSWGICGASERSSAAVDRLRPQDGLYTVAARDANDEALRVVGALREQLFALGNPTELRQRLSDPTVHVATVTVTEKGYRHDPASGHLNLEDPEVAADLAGRPPRTVVFQLVAGLRARFAEGAGPIAIVSCDNLPGNGVLLHRLVSEAAEHLPPPEATALLDWMAANVTFPSTLVDRIVPATTAADVAHISARLGLHDAAPVVTEPFSQWVIEDAFRASRPAWDTAGALITRDVVPYETMKLRLLNASHSAIAYLGGLAGCATVAEALDNSDLADYAKRLMDEDASPTLRVPDGFDLAAYKASILARLANPALTHSLAQIAADGSQKLPVRLLATARDALAGGSDFRWVALAVAGWMRYMTVRQADDASPIVPDDPLAGAVSHAAAGADNPRSLVARLLGIEEIFGPDLRESAAFSQMLVGDVDHLAADGALRTIAMALHGR